MKTVLKMLATATVALSFLSSCSDTLEDQIERLDKFVSTNRYGSSADVWLVKNNAFGDAERVSLIFGFMDDFQFCQEIAQLYMSRYPSDRYSCKLAN